MLCVGFNIIIYYNKSECKLSFQNSDEKLKYQKIWYFSYYMQLYTWYTVKLCYLKLDGTI